MNNFAQTKGLIGQIAAQPEYSAGMTPIGPATNFLQARGLEIESVLSVEAGHGVVYIRGRETWVACFMWQLEDCVLCVNATDRITMPPKFQGIFDHRSDLVIGVATGRDFNQICARVFAQENDGSTYPAAARKLREVMAPNLCDRLRIIAIMRNKTRMVRFAFEQAESKPDRLKRLYTNLTFAPAEKIDNTIVWSKQVHDESSQRQ